MENVQFERVRDISESGNVYKKQNASMALLAAVRGMADKRMLQLQSHALISKLQTSN
jgi:hypothetical protein